MNRADFLILSLFQLLINKINDWTGKDRFFLAKIFLMLMPPIVALYFITGVLGIDPIEFKIFLTAVTAWLTWLIIANIKRFSYVKDVEKRAEFMDNPSDALDMKYYMIMGLAASTRFVFFIFPIFLGAISIILDDISSPILFYSVTFLLHSLFLYVLSCANPPGKKQKKLVLQRQTN